MKDVSEYIKKTEPVAFKADGSKIYDCPVCLGKKKFEVDAVKPVWFCHKCGIGGRVGGLQTKGSNLRIKGGGVEGNQEAYAPVHSDDVYMHYLKEVRQLSWRKLFTLFPHSGPAKVRVYFPFYDLGGCIPVYFVGRCIFEGSPFPNYMNPTMGEFPRRKSEVLWGLHRIHGVPESLTICEGIFDAVQFDDGLAILGKSVSKRQLEILNQIDAADITVVLDGDAGIEAITLAQRLGRHTGARVYNVRLPVDKDPGMIENMEPYLKRKVRIA